jgi:hypothetical protein
MSSTSLIAEQPPQSENRRLHPRHNLERLAYVELGPDNGGILTDASEGGLSFQGVQPLGEGQFLHFKFILPAMRDFVEGTGQTVWLNSSRKGGGLRFVDLSERAQQLVKEWISGESPSGSEGQQLAASPGALEAKHLKSSPTLVWTASEETIAVSFKGSAIEPPQDSACNLHISPAVGNAHTPIVATSCSNTRPQSEIDAVVAHNSQQKDFRIQSFSKPELQEQRAPSDLPDRNSRPVQIVMIAQSGCVVILAAILGISQLGRVASRRRGADGAIASTSALSPGGTSRQTFKVEVVDANNRRWILSNGGEDPLPFLNSTLGSEGPTNVPAATTNPQEQKNDVSPPRQWDLRVQPPPMLKSASAPSTPDLREPAVVDTIVLVEVLINSRVVTPISPELPKPLQPQPEAVHQSSGLQEPVLIHRVDPTYPPLMRQFRSRRGHSRECHHRGKRCPTEAHDFER